MKHVFSVFSVACVVAFTLFMSTMNSACKKEKGDKGDTGTANVMYSPWLDVTYSVVKNTAGDTVAWVGNIPAPKLTKNILDSGAVKVYWNAGTPASPAVFPLPFNDAYGLAGVQNLNVYFTVDTINLYATEDASTYLTSGTKANQYRYVIIPGGTSTGRSAVNYNNYEAVKQYFNIPD
jgi:hypothetical protein